MSYPPQGPGQQYGYPPPSHSPQPGYGQPPPQQYGGYPQQPPPPQQGHWGQPPPQNFGPPQGHPQQWQQPPQQHGFHQQPPPPQQYPPQNYGPPALPSPGYDPRAQAQGDARNDAQALRTAMKGFGTNEEGLIKVLSKPDPLQMALLRNTFNQQFRGRDLEKDVTSETSGYFREGLVAIIRGPLMTDVSNVNRAVKGLGTKETLLNDVLLGRSNADMRAIKQLYYETYRKPMESDVKGDLSMKTEQLFDMVMAATRNEESAPVLPQQIDSDIAQLHGAMGARVGTDQITVCSILSNRSDGQIRAIAHAYQQKFRKSLEDTIRSEFSGHMQDALMLIVSRASDRAMCDAIQLEETMAGMGTKDDLLTQRVVRLHWNRAHMDQVKRAYQHRYKKDLISRVISETSLNRSDIVRGSFIYALYPNALIAFNTAGE